MRDAKRRNESVFDSKRKVVKEECSQQGAGILVNETLNPKRVKCNNKEFGGLDQDDEACIDFNNDE